jgi:hypothetical protein
MKQIIAKNDLDNTLVVIDGNNKVTIDLDQLKEAVPEIKENLYTKDGTLTGNRTVNQNGKTLRFIGGTWNEVNIHGNSASGGYISVSGKLGKSGMYQSGKGFGLWSEVNNKDVLQYSVDTDSIIFGSGGGHAVNAWFRKGVRDINGDYGTKGQVFTTNGIEGNSASTKWRDTVTTLFKEDGGTAASASGTTIEVSEDISNFKTLHLNLEWGGNGDHCKTIPVDVEMLLAGKRIMFSNTTFTHAAANYVKLGADNTHLKIALDDDVDSNNYIISVKGVL